jgi:replicative DNA helicase
MFDVRGESAGRVRLPPRLDELIPNLERMARSGPLADWGFESLNRAAPWPIGSMAVVSAPKGGGKTSFALQVARQHAAKRGPVLYVAMEGTAELLTARAYGQAMGVDHLQLAIGKLSVDPVVVTADPLHLAMRLDPDLIEPTLDLIAETDPRPPLLVTDYVQHFAMGAREIRPALINVLGGLLKLTEGREMWTLAVSQTSRAGAKRARRKQRGSGEQLIDVDAESGVTEDFATVKLIMTFEPRLGEAVTDVDIAIAKVRYGATGVILPFRFEGATGRWSERGPDTRARRDIVEAFKRRGPAGFDNKTAARKDVGGRAEDFGNEYDALIADGVLVEGAGRVTLAEYASG